MHQHMNFSVLLAKFSTGLMDKGIHQNGIFLERNTFDSYPQKIRMTTAVLYFPHSPTSIPPTLAHIPNFSIEKVLSYVRYRLKDSARL